MVKGAVQDRKVYLQVVGQCVYRMAYWWYLVSVESCKEVPVYVRITAEPLLLPRANR